MVSSGARTPEELETLFEDAFVTRDREALADLFEEEAVLVTGNGRQQARGGAEIVLFATAMWERDRTYLAEPRRVIQARDTALVIAEGGINVVRRGSDGAWRYAIALLSFNKHGHRGGGMTQEMHQAQALKPLAVHANEGEARWWFGSLAELKATAADTGGQMTIVEVTAPSGLEAPLHVHHRDDEAFWILEGDATIEVGETTIEAHAGDYVFAPRDIPHRYTVGEAGCRMLFILVPGGIENVIRETSERARSRTLPPPPEQEPDIDRLKSVVAAHGYELLI